MGWIKKILGWITKFFKKFLIFFGLKKIKTETPPSQKAKPPPLFLSRFKNNPILKPIARHFWERDLVFNPAAVEVGDRVHMVYRAVGDPGISVMGYASSKDGLHFDKRLDKPIFFPSQSFESNHHAPACLSSFMSGGGAGGCEDPKITKIGDRLYMSYVAWDGWNNPRVALTSIAVDDFLAHRWQWEKPVLISPPGQTHKNWVIFPEKINNKYAILHSIAPRISVAYVDSLQFDGNTFIDSYYNGTTRRDCWDNWVRGAGPPPIKTDDGWLLFYHAMDHQDPGRYKVGAMMLDLKDPAKVLYRSQNPILEPDEVYENEGFKGGVVYASGALALKNNLFVYYGAADTVVCGAKAPLPEFLDNLKHHRVTQLKPVVAH